MKKREQTPPVEVTLGEDDVVKKKKKIPFLGRLSFQAENTAERPYKSSDEVFKIFGAY